VSPVRRVQLIPPERSWIPYAWLIYLGAFFIEPIIRGWNPGYWAATIAGALVFLVSYFRGYWERGARLVAIVAFQVALGIGFSPVNSGSAVFFVYAASFAGQLERAKDAVRLIALITVIGAIMSWILQPPAYYWVSAIVFAPLIGGVNVHFRQVEKANTGLRRAHAEIERLAAVAERERIARDLHDVLGHTLSLIILKSELASKLADHDAARAAKEIREVEQVARTAMAEVRETIRGYRTTLDAEVARARALLETAGIPGEFSVELTAPDAARDEVLAFVLREGVTNVVRHSDATVCRVRVEQSTDGCTLTIADDGRGAILTEGTGLRGMRERVDAAGGTLAYEASSGTRLTVKLPATTSPGTLPAVSAG
jgi:two-component system, NarL family, sensor histidine kinase DesK